MTAVCLSAPWPLQSWIWRFLPFGQPLAKTGELLQPCHSGWGSWQGCFSLEQSWTQPPGGTRRYRRPWTSIHPHCQLAGLTACLEINYVCSLSRPTALDMAVNNPGTRVTQIDEINGLGAVFGVWKEISSSHSGPKF